MASTVTRRALRRARLGSRHTYRAIRRHRVATLIAAVVIATAIGTTAVATGDLPSGGDRPSIAGHQHQMLDARPDGGPDGMPDPMGGHRN